jgi:hypothetical protein
MIGQCDSRTICLDSIDDLPPGYIALVSFGVLIAVALAGGGGFLGWKILGHHGHGPHGGSAKDFAAE